MVVIQVSITHPDIPVIGGCTNCQRSIRSEWYDKDDVIEDPLCDACEEDIIVTWENELSKLAAMGDEMAIQTLINMRVELPDLL